MMSVQKAREAYLKNVPGLFDTLERLHAEKGPEVKFLLGKLRKVALAVSSNRGPDALRESLANLFSAMMERRFQLIVNPESLRFMLYIRHFGIATMKALNLDDMPLPPAPAMAGAAVRRSRQQPIVLQQQPVQQQVVQPKQAIQQHRPLLLFVKQEPDLPDSPATSQPKNKLKRSLPVTPVTPMVTDKAAPSSSRRTLVRVKQETEECIYCGSVVDTDPTQLLKHYFKYHKEHVSKLNPDPELVCKSVAYCDHISGTVLARKIHEGRSHGKNPADIEDVIPEFEKGYKCTYCGVDVARIALLKEHMRTCKRDERPMLGCSACPEEAFHYIIEFTDHVKSNGGVTHGCPVMLPGN